MSLYKVTALPREGCQFVLFAEPWNPDGAGRTQEGHADHQRPHTELKPAAFALRRLGNDRIGLHGRIIPHRGRSEQGILGGWTRAAQFLARGLAGPLLNRYAKAFTASHALLSARPRAWPFL